MDNNKKLFEGLLKADGINPAGAAESERIAFGKMLDRQLESKRTKSASWPSIWKMITKSKIAKFAIAAIIIITAGLFFVNYGRYNSIRSPKIVMTPASKTPAEMLTMASLNLAYRHGGIEAVEQQLSEADKKMRQSSKDHLTMEQMLCELGECKDI